MAGADRQHPPFPAAEVPGPGHPRSRNHGGRQGQRLLGACRDRGAGCRRSARTGRSADRARRHAAESRRTRTRLRALALSQGLERIRASMSDPLDRVRAAALDLPETEEKLSHGQPTFFVAGKQFAQFRDNHHGDSRTVVCVRVSSLDEQAMLLEADPVTYSKPAYMPSWLSISLAGKNVD